MVFKKKIIIYLFLAARGLGRCLWAASCGEGAALHCSAWTSHCSGFSWCGAQTAGERSSVVSCTGLVAQQLVESSRTRDRTHVPSIDR